MRDAILDVVTDLLATGGTDAVQLRAVARRAHVSLATIYKHFPTRDELVVAALERWMDEHCYARLSAPPPGETLYDGLMRVFRQVFEPWERTPRMLEAYHRARTGPLGARLDGQGADAVEPVARAVLARAEPAYAQDIALVLTNMAYAVVGRFAGGDLEATAILPTLERAVFRLTADNVTAASAGARAQPMRSSDL
jgi:AcrR family transcriptional regulator